MYHHGGKKKSLEVADPEQKFRKFQKKAGKRKKEKGKKSKSQNGAVIDKPDNNDKYSEVTTNRPQTPMRQNPIEEKMKKKKKKLLHTYNRYRANQ
jgi:hypothetical protein